MIDPRTIFTFAVILAYAGVFLVFRKKYISLLGGIEYLFVGYLASFLSIDTIQLKPILYAFLGWIGLLLGMQLKLTYLKELPGTFYVKTSLYTVGTALVAGTLFFLLDFHTGAFVAGIALSSVCYKTAAHFIPARDKQNRFALFFISFLPFILLLLLLVFYSLTSTLIESLFLLFVIIVFSIILRIALALLEDRNSVFLLLVGFIIFISETCAILKISPLVTCFFIGIYLSNLSHWKEVIFKLVYKDEKQLYTLFLLLLGMISGIALDNKILFDIVFITLGIGLIKYAAYSIPVLGLNQYNRFLFLGPGGFAIAVMTDYWLKSGTGIDNVWFSSILISIILLQFFSIFMGKREKNK